ncbi:ZIP family metal transporter [Salinithrix halophila]|uniref:ZIP family metal transporter n=1 Tax=Salinithrix halophila TaxID=1485204 RepID=A0ABV8JKR1_9BACL
MKEALWLSALSGLSSFLGVAAVLFFPRLSNRLIAAALSLSATVMLLVALFDLLPTAVRVRASFVHVGLGMAAALLVMLSIHYLLERADSPDTDAARFGRLGWYLAVAIIAHNVPEGMAIGIGYGTERELGLTLAMAMAIHNIPEGVGMAAPLLASGRSVISVLGISLLAGGALPFGTWFGLRFLLHSPDAVAAGLFFASTTMIWVVTMEVMPRALEIQRRSAWIGLVLGGVLAWGIHLFHG